MLGTGGGAHHIQNETVGVGSAARKLGIVDLQKGRILELRCVVHTDHALDGDHVTDLGLRCHLIEALARGIVHTVNEDLVGSVGDHYVTVGGILDLLYGTADNELTGGIAVLREGLTELVGLLDGHRRAVCRLIGNLEYGRRVGIGVLLGHKGDRELLLVGNRLLGHKLALGERCGLKVGVGADHVLGVIDHREPSADVLLVVEHGGLIRGEAEVLARLTVLEKLDVRVDVLLRAVDLGIDLDAALCLLNAEDRAVLRVAAKDVLILIVLGRALQEEDLACGVLHDEELIVNALLGVGNDQRIVRTDHGNLTVEFLGNGLTVGILDGRGQLIAERRIVGGGDVHRPVACLGALNDLDLVAVGRPGYLVGNAVNDELLNNVEIVYVLGALFILHYIVKEIGRRRQRRVCRAALVSVVPFFTEAGGQHREGHDEDQE